MDVSLAPLHERIARVLAARRLSGNADGDSLSAGDAVDAAWPGHSGDALAVLRTLREPDAAMAHAGDPRVWADMVDVALAGAEAAGPA